MNQKKNNKKQTNKCNVWSATFCYLLTLLSYPAFSSTHLSIGIMLPLQALLEAT